MIIELEDKRIPLASELKPKINIDDLVFKVVFSGLWVAMTAWIISSYLTGY